MEVRVLISPLRKDFLIITEPEIIIMSAIKIRVTIKILFVYFFITSII